MNLGSKHEKFTKYQLGHVDISLMSPGTFTGEIINCDFVYFPFRGADFCQAAPEKILLSYYE